MLGEIGIDPKKGEGAGQREVQRAWDVLVISKSYCNQLNAFIEAQKRGVTSGLRTAPMQGG